MPQIKSNLVKQRFLIKIQIQKANELKEKIEILEEKSVETLALVDTGPLVR